MGILNQTDHGGGGGFRDPLVWRLTMRLLAIPLAVVAIAAWGPIRAAWAEHFSKCASVLPVERLETLTGQTGWSSTYTYSGSYSCTLDWKAGEQIVWVDLDRGYGGEGTARVWRQGLRDERPVDELAPAWEGFEKDGALVLVVMRPDGLLRVRTSPALDGDQRAALHRAIAAQLDGIDAWAAEK